MRHSLEELEKNYKLELGKILQEIKNSDAKSVLLQLPDGLKPWASTLADYIEEKSDADIRIWLGDCFGACDLPDSDCDLVIQFGHAPW